MGKKINDNIFYKSIQLDIQRQLFDLKLFNVLVEFDLSDNDNIGWYLYNPYYMTKEDGYAQYINRNQSQEGIKRIIFKYAVDIIDQELKTPNITLTQQELEDLYKVKIDITEHEGWPN